MPRAKEAPLVALRCFLLRQDVASYRDALRDPDQLQTQSMKGGLDYEGELWYRSARRSAPKWREFLKPGFTAELPEFKTTSQGAVLFVRVHERIIAFTFGQGRHLIDSEKCEPDFGLKTALNMSVPGTLTSIDLHNFEERTKHTRIHLSAKASVDAFGIDVDRDIMRAVAGESNDQNICRDVAGAEQTLAIIARVTIDTLGTTAAGILSAYDKNDYQSTYPWVDNLARIKMKGLIDELDGELLRLIDGNQLDRVALAVPEPLDPIDVEYVAYSKDGNPVPELSIPGYLSSRKRQVPLSIHHMRDNHAIWIKRVDMPTSVRGASVYKCIVAEIDYQDKMYILTNGSWFLLNKDFADSVRSFIGSMTESEVDLPSWDGKAHEGDYNAGAANLHDSFVLLDKKLARCYGNSSTVEVCDLLTDSKQIIHVKRRDRCSSGLSHLFMQGRNSGEMLAFDNNFVKEARALIDEAKPGFCGQIPENGFQASDYEIVYALMGADPESIREKLPFFSQLTLMHSAKHLTGLGYKVTIKGIPIMVAESV